ncbi:universal stress protein [Leptolyngbya sp. NK1-12]|uniref:Universal stress protein n=1 Tax=Leptolyngbya sp. NK1-12 TaxID=2547451 RepID=A0AA96WHV7_9CYAN|nr:universal stress protein [Leptolyngbya sp. NK1-12]MBF2050250.1 universal stress protein [Elainella sp. C42_A2020_010]WNZ25588.1 universal stress protein [Leptolyngbya sp. NK1-12]
MGFHRILAAIDHSPLSQAVFEQALDLATTNQAQLLLFHCLTADLVSAPPFAGELGISPQLVNQAYQSQYVRFEEQLHHSRLLLHHYREMAAQKGVTAECDYRVIEPGQGLCQAALNWNADLLILGRRGRKGLTEVLLGSVSNYVLHHAPCAVLVIQAEPSALEGKEAQQKQVKPAVPSNLAMKQ